MSPRVVHGDCLEIMKMLPDNSVDSVVTDPPYGLGFMGKAWDALPPGKEWAEECLRVLKPGGHLLAFGGTRTWHRLAVAVEDAGFEIRDSIAWMYGSGFPKSLDVSKAIDKRRDEDHAPRDIVRQWLNARRLEAGLTHNDVNLAFGHASNGGGSSSAWMTNPTSKALPTMEQWATLKNLFGFDDSMDDKVSYLNDRKNTAGDDWGKREVIGQSAHKSGIGNKTEGHYTVGGTVAQHVTLTAPASEEASQWQGWGTALKPAFEPIVFARKPLIGTVAANVQTHGAGALNIDKCRIGTDGGTSRSGQADYPRNEDGTEDRSQSWARTGHSVEQINAGRWPANVALDEHMAAVLDGQSGVLPSRGGAAFTVQGYHGVGRHEAAGTEIGYGDTGGASRFFYVAKAPKKERPIVDGTAHPTVKPLALMRWLVRLVTPPGGTVLEPFAGSGATVEACILEGLHCIAIEREAEYLPLIQARIDRQDAA